ncbi:type IV secretion protein DotU [Caulobacter sp. Root655]|uniref:type IVB secretion system protein IcmH/DotU n=1 Tax=Caulobacter sp. Root655 TaxID=1736578 RepID=UPI0006FA3989|nr:type IVB secretion system protein IcmH/DotU [Caulobacter sp. Root655]KRA59188.1 type IV secretion protein DotU [Caulobacter sp. Root655]
MTDDGDEKNPNKTVFRPSPLQNLRQSSQPSAAPAFTPDDVAAFASSPFKSTRAPRRATGLDDDIPLPPAAARSRNPMMMAAAPILSLIVAVRSGRVHLALPELHQEASASVATFDQALVTAGYDTETRQRARYAICATIDDIAQNLPGQDADGAEWARRSLVVQVFNENIGGDRFWRLLDDMLAKPAEFANLIELYHACLAAGFEGRYRVAPDGKRRLHEIMASVYAALSHTRGLSQTELSPRWRGQPTPAARVSFWATLALAGAIALGVLLALFILLRVVLIQTGQPSLAALKAINPDQPLRMSRVAPAPPVLTSTQLQRLQGFLAPEIAQHLVAVEQDAQSIRVRTTVGQLFRSGSDKLEPGREALFARIGAAIEAERGSVRVEGHADTDRLASITFPDNFALSKARADAAARILRGKLTDPARVSTEGFGDSQPIAPNSSANGKALNRRVEIVIPRAE